MQSKLAFPKFVLAVDCAAFFTLGVFAPLIAGHAAANNTPSGIKLFDELMNDNGIAGFGISALGTLISIGACIAMITVMRRKHVALQVLIALIYIGIAAMGLGTLLVLLLAKLGALGLEYQRWWTFNLIVNLGTGGTGCLVMCRMPEYTRLLRGNSPLPNGMSNCNS